MTILSVNFVQRARFTTPVGLCFFFIGICAAGLVTWTFLDAQTDLEQAQTRLARVQRSSKSPRLVVTVPAVQRDEDKSLLRASTQLRRPWSDLLTELDLSASPSVALLSVESQGQTRTLRISGEAKTMADVVAYVNRLRQLPILESAYLSQHENKQSGPVDVIRFSLDATWRGSP